MSHRDTHTFMVAGTGDGLRSGPEVDVQEVAKENVSERTGMNFLSSSLWPACDGLHWAESQGLFFEGGGHKFPRSEAKTFVYMDITSWLQFGAVGGDAGHLYSALWVRGHLLFVLSQPPCADWWFPASESTVVWTFPECVLLDPRVPAATTVFLTSSCHGT